MKQLIRKALRKFGMATIGDLGREFEANRMLTAKLLIEQLFSDGSVKTIQESEFRVFSQWGEDGIIQYLLHNIIIENDMFVEFGVENYLESNTRFLLLNNNWSGLVIDGVPDNVSFIKSDDIYWRHELSADCAFIDKDNINELISRNGVSGDIGLLSVDIDGNDYWVWESIDVISPRIVVCEYNSLWGADLSVSIPYDESFIRSQAHYSNLYFGASITALTNLANAKGYSLVGSNMAGNNLFFVRNDQFGDLAVTTPGEAWVKSKFRESRDEQGSLTCLPFEERLKQVSHLPLVNTEDGKQYSIRELYSVA